MIGVNMLTIAEENPEKIARAMGEVIRMTEEGILNPHVGGEYAARRNRKGPCLFGIPKIDGEDCCQMVTKY